MGETIPTNVRFRSSTHVRGISSIYMLNKKIQEIFPKIGGKGEKCQLSVRLVWKQVGLSVYRSYVTYVSDSIQ